MTEQPPPKELTDPEQVRLLAHPLRQRIAQILRNGPVSSTSLARELGESTGSTSYHLRRLAKYGFVEEVPELAKGRERWWRVVPGDRRLPRTAGSRRGCGRPSGRCSARSTPTRWNCSNGSSGPATGSARGGTPCCSRTRPSRSRPNRYGRSSRSTSR
ncbi:transcriptional regulator [Actinomadura sp. J1-007]|uniref:ArsR/SmtB family transcription factor n=1 Tax=Actinomadura sp. J1-007 TaxID=2661913 RepID=UPI0019D559B3|nr:winged helix-turn-helix domain-containing protein [Actinomadura sp. J1-007]